MFLRLNSIEVTVTIFYVLKFKNFVIGVYENKKERKKERASNYLFHTISHLYQSLKYPHGCSTECFLNEKFFLKK